MKIIIFLFVAVLNALCTIEVHGGVRSNSQPLSQAEKEFARDMMYIANQAYDWDNFALEFLWIGVPLDLGDPIADKYGYHFEGAVEVSNKYAQLWTKNGKCFVAFRGSNDLNDWLENFEALYTTPVTVTNPNGNSYTVVKPFYEHYKALRDGPNGEHEPGSLKHLLASHSCNPADTWSTGHSLGGANAVVAQADGLVGKSITFEAPEVFYGSSCNNAFRNNAYRYYLTLDNKPDLVPAVPGDLATGHSHCANTNVELHKDKVWFLLVWWWEYKTTIVSESHPNVSTDSLLHVAGNAINLIAHLPWNMVRMTQQLSGENSSANIIGWVLGRRMLREVSVTSDYGLAAPTMLGFIGVGLAALAAVGVIVRRFHSTSQTSQEEEHPAS